MARMNGIRHHSIVLFVIDEIFLWNKLKKEEKKFQFFPSSPTSAVSCRIHMKRRNQAMFDVREMDKQKPYTSIIFHLFLCMSFAFSVKLRFHIISNIYITECSSFAIISNSMIFLCRIFFPSSLSFREFRNFFFLLLSFFVAIII